MTRKELESALVRYIPEQAVAAVASMIVEMNVHLRITRARSSKLGDYRAPFGGKGHRISINHNLNSYAFLVTLVHELAHLTTWNKHKHAVDPHGKEWKQEFRGLMLPFLQKECFPADVQAALEAYLRNPAAASCSDPHLMKTLGKYDEQPGLLLENLPHGAIFALGRNMIFRKGEKKRTRYRCQELGSGRFYMVSAVAEVFLPDGQAPD
jgi:SprT protein